jgi:farnesyl diphosphate synthase
MASTTKRSDFEAVWLTIAQDILDNAKQYGIPDQAYQWFEKVIDALRSFKEKQR